MNDAFFATLQFDFMIASAALFVVLPWLVGVFMMLLSLFRGGITITPKSSTPPPKTEPQAKQNAKARKR